MESSRTTIQKARHTGEDDLDQFNGNKSDADSVGLLLWML